MEKVEKSSLPFLPSRRRDQDQLLMSPDECDDCAEKGKIRQTIDKHELVSFTDYSLRGHQTPRELEALALSPKLSARRQIYLMPSKLHPLLSQLSVSSSSKKLNRSSGERQRHNLQKQKQWWSAEPECSTIKEKTPTAMSEGSTSSQTELLLHDQGVVNRAFDDLLSIPSSEEEMNRKPATNGDAVDTKQSNQQLDAVQHILVLLTEVKGRIQQTSGEDLQALNRLFNDTLIQRAGLLNEKISNRLGVRFPSRFPSSRSTRSADLTFGSTNRVRRQTPQQQPQPQQQRQSVKLQNHWQPQLEQIGQSQQQREQENEQLLIQRYQRQHRVFQKCTMKEEPTLVQKASLMNKTSTDKFNQTISLEEADLSKESMGDKFTLVDITNHRTDNSKSVDAEPKAEATPTLDEQNNESREKVQLESSAADEPDVHTQVTPHKAPNSADQLDCIPKNDPSESSESDGYATAEPRVAAEPKHTIETSLVDGQKLKTITLYKDCEPLGATVRNEGEAVVVARVIKGGVAERRKLLRQGDEIMRINDVDIRGKEINEVAELMSMLSGELRLVIRVSCTPQLGAISRSAPRRNITVRAQFDYDVTEDSYIPCVELGVSFKVGDILHVMSRDDPHWWQAYREGDSSESLAGLIPSRLFWETREQIRLAILAETDESIKQKTQFGCCASAGKRLSNKRKSYKYEQYQAEPEYLLTYEEVGSYHPLPIKKRPIVLVGCEELRLHKICERMVALDKLRFAQPIRTSSHPSMFSSDKNSPLLHFLPHDKFIERIKNEEFIEYKVTDIPEMHYHGVSRQSVVQVIDSGVTCITHCQPKNINNLRTKELKPYIVFIAAPPIKRLKDFLRSESAIEPMADECRHIIDLSRHTESTYTHLYDYVLTLVNMEQACAELLTEVNRLDVEPQWVPVEWVPQVNGKTNSNYIDVSAASQRKSTVIGCDEVSSSKVVSRTTSLNCTSSSGGKEQRQSVTVDCHTPPTNTSPVVVASHETKDDRHRGGFINSGGIFTEGNVIPVERSWTEDL